MIPPPPRSTLFPYTTLFRSHAAPSSANSGTTRPTPTSTGSCSTGTSMRSEEHTSELQSRGQLVCRLLLEKKNDREGHRPGNPPAHTRHDGTPARPQDHHQGT